MIVVFGSTAGAQAADSELRSWTDSTGQYRVRAAAASAEWLTFRGPNRDGKTPDTGLLKEWPEGGPKLLWKVSDIGKGWSGVAVAGGTVYITGDLDDKLMLFAFDLDGQLKWKVDNGVKCDRGGYLGARATPTIDAPNLYLLSGNGRLGCFNAQTGEPRWSKEARDFGGRSGRSAPSARVRCVGPLQSRAHSDRRTADVSPLVERLHPTATGRLTHRSRNNCHVTSERQGASRRYCGQSARPGTGG